MPVEGKDVGLIQKKRLKFFGAELRVSLFKHCLSVLNKKLPPPSVELQDGPDVVPQPVPDVKWLPEELKSVQVFPLPP